MTPTSGMQWVVRQVLRKVLRGREWLIFPFLLLYWISPIDLMPLVPIDDLIVTALGFLAYRFLRKGNDDPKTSKSDVIDVEGKIIS